MDEVELSKMIKLIDENQYRSVCTPRAIVRDFSKFEYLLNIWKSQNLEFTINDLLNLFGSMEIHIPVEWVNLYTRVMVFK